MIKPRPQRCSARGGFITAWRKARLNEKIKNMEENQKILIDQLREVYEQRKARDPDYAYGDLSRDLGYAHTASLISQLFSSQSKYKITRRLEKAIQKEIENERSFNRVQATGVKKRFSFVETSNWQKFYEVAALCQANGEIGTFTGPPGSGKTRAILHYESRISNVIKVKAHVSFSPNDVLADYCEKLGLETKGSIHKKLMAIIGKVTDGNWLFVVDESEKLSAKAIDIIRNFNDEAEAGVLFVGTEDFKNKIIRMRYSYKYLYRRITVPAIIKKLDYEDSKQLIQTELPESPEVIYRMFYELSDDAGQLENLVFKSLMAAKNAGVEIDSDGFKDVIRQTSEALHERSRVA